MLNAIIRRCPHTGRAAKFRAPNKTTFVESREPTDEERGHGAAHVFIRLGSDGQMHTILASDCGERPAQFGASLSVMDENQIEVNAWHRKLRQQRYLATPPSFKIEIDEQRLRRRL